MPVNNVICPFCRGDIPPNSHYCVFCGKDLTGQKMNKADSSYCSVEDMHESKEELLKGQDNPDYSGPWLNKFVESIRDEINLIKTLKQDVQERDWFETCISLLSIGAGTEDPVMLYLAGEIKTYFRLDEYIAFLWNPASEELLNLASRNARELYLKAAEKKEPHALLWCAYCLETGAYGFPESADRSVGYLQAYLKTENKLKTLLLPELVFLRNEAEQIKHKILEAERDENDIAAMFDFDYDRCRNLLPDPGENALIDRLDELHHFMVGLGLPSQLNLRWGDAYNKDAKKLNKIKTDWLEWCLAKGIVLTMD